MLDPGNIPPSPTSTFSSPKDKIYQDPVRWYFDGVRSEICGNCLSCGFQTQLSIVLSFLGCSYCCPCTATSALLQETCLVHVRQGEALGVWGR